MHRKATSRLPVSLPPDSGRFAVIQLLGLTGGAISSQLGAADPASIVM